MKKLALLALVGGLFSAHSYADSVSCYVDTAKYDRYSQGFCYGSETRENWTPKVSFKVNTTKSVTRVDWVFSGSYNRSSASNCTSTQCAVEVFKTEGRVQACVDKIYYADYTWEDVNWCADAEYLFTDGGFHY